MQCQFFYLLRSMPRTNNPKGMKQTRFILMITKKILHRSPTSERAVSRRPISHESVKGRRADFNVDS